VVLPILPGVLVVGIVGGGHHVEIRQPAHVLEGLRASEREDCDFPPQAGEQHGARFDVCGLSGLIVRRHWRGDMMVIEAK
jgi:hypothetical protein